MKLKSTLLVMTSALLMGTSLNAMAQQPAAPQPAAQQAAPQPGQPALNAPTPAPEKAVDPSHVMAVIDGKDITAGQLDEMAADIDPNLARLPDGQRRLTVLKIYVDMKAFSDAAVTAGVDKTPTYTQRMAVMRDNVLQQLYFKTQVVDKISDADVKVRYDKEIAALPKEEEVHARHILVKTKAEAEAIIKQLDKGANFEALAKKDSTDGSAAVGGDLGYFSHGQMVKPFEDATFALKVGSYTEKPVESPFGWHVIKLEDRRQKQPPAFDDVKDAIRGMIARDRYKDIISELRAKENIKYPDAEVERLMKDAGDGAAMPGEDQQEDGE